MNVIYAQPDGKLAVLTPAKGVPIEEVIKRDIPEGEKFRVVESLNVDPDFFEAYDFKNGKAVFNVERGRAMWRDKWRDARKPLLDALDVQFMQALESGTREEQETIAGRKMLLRRVTDLDIPGKTPSTIRQVWPEILGPMPS